MRPIVNGACFLFWWNVKAGLATSSEVESVYKVKSLAQERKTDKTSKTTERKTEFFLHASFMD